MEDILYHAQISKDLEKKLGEIQVSDDEVKNYYSDNPEYRTAHILFRTKAVASPNELKAAVDTAAKVYRQVMNEPHRFAEFANKYSQSQNAETGGDIGYQPGGMLAPEYYAAIKGKKLILLHSLSKLNMEFTSSKYLERRSIHKLIKKFMKNLFMT